MPSCLYGGCQQRPHCKRTDGKTVSANAIKRRSMPAQSTSKPSTSPSLLIKPSNSKEILPNLLQQPRSNPFNSYASQHPTPRPQRRRTPFAQLSHPDQCTSHSPLRRRDNRSRSNLLVQTKHDGLDEQLGRNFKHRRTSIHRRSLRRVDYPSSHSDRPLGWTNICHRWRFLKWE
jgi:hypothetical protein